MKNKFVYVIYIRTTQQKLWDALTKPELTKKYWCNSHQESDWRQGSPWRIVLPDGTTTDMGEIIEIDPPKKLVLKWQNEWRPELKAEGPSRATIFLEPVGDTIKLTVTHEIEKDDSKFLGAVSNGWPAILSSLKSLLETGESHEHTRKTPTRDKCIV